MTNKSANYSFESIGIEEARALILRTLAVRAVEAGGYQTALGRQFIDLAEAFWHISDAWLELLLRPRRRERP